jgi:sterol desaturase/sphingolipid hydroxylase (fatty acid hydroxylase superfamily)
MQFIDFINPIVRITVLIVLLVAIEQIVPFRKAVKVDSDWRRWRINLSLTLCTIVIFTACFFALASAVHYVVQAQWGLFQRMALPPIIVLLFGIVILDAVTYLAHRLLHAVPWLWALHKVHHEDRMVDAGTSFRQHPIEAVFRVAMLGIAALLFGIPLAVLAIYRLASSINALIEHANIYTPLWFDKWVSLLWVSPRMHKVHHSDLRQETDSNFGNLLSLFDRLFHTFTPVERAVSVTYGLDDPPANTRAHRDWALRDSGSPRL